MEKCSNTLGYTGVLSQSSIFGQNPKIEYQEFNELQTLKLSKKQLCDRTVIMPWYPIMFEKSKKAFTVSYKTFLIFERKIRFVMPVHDRLCVKCINMLLKFV